MRDLNFKCLAEGKGTTVTVRDPNRAGEDADKVLQRIYTREIWPGFTVFLPP